MVKVYVATKRKLAVGDQDGRTPRNKGVVSRLLPEEDMPFFEDGPLLTVVLEPLGRPLAHERGVRSLEAHLGFCQPNVWGKPVFWIWLGRRQSLKGH